MRVFLILPIFLPSLFTLFAAETVTLRLWHSHNTTTLDKPATLSLEIVNQIQGLTLKGVKPFAMRIKKMHWFINFLNTYAGFPVINDEVVIKPAAMKSALSAYKYLLDNNLTENNCDIDCTNTRFFSR